MKILKIFKKNKKSEKIVKEKEEIIDSNLPLCASCGSNIEQWEAIKTFDKKKYHVKCFRKLKRQASKMAFEGGI